MRTTAIESQVTLALGVEAETRRRRRASRLFTVALPVLFVGCFALSGCAHRDPAASRHPAGLTEAPVSIDARDLEQARALEASLAAIDPSVDREEARRLAECACASSRELAREYGAVRPAFLHNMLVNAGFKRRGLCHHWADDLYARFLALGLRTLEVQLAIARPGTRREHNGVVATATARSFEQGIVLDAWRRSGWLYFSQVKLDRYPWEKILSREEAGLAGTNGPAARDFISPASSGLPPGTGSRP